MIIYVGTNNSSGNKNPSEIANEIVELVKQKVKRRQRPVKR